MSSTLTFFAVGYLTSKIKQEYMSIAAERTINCDEAKIKSLIYLTLKSTTQCDQSGAVPKLRYISETHSSLAVVVKCLICHLKETMLQERLVSIGRERWVTADNQFHLFIHRLTGSASPKSLPFI